MRRRLDTSVLQEFALLHEMGARYVAPTMLEEYGDAAWEVLQDRWRLC